MVTLFLIGFVVTWMARPRTDAEKLMLCGVGAGLLIVLVASLMIVHSLITMRN